ncbi:peptide-methionine (R)-S-oxide reductase MsrB [Micrococcales bacterium 31B]|nr:peptide-methionine (R)-S-oxide reductase MsrB [Micrococcales bacterium 31B]
MFKRHATPATSPQTYTYALSEAEWREKLSPLEYQVLREAGTERPFTGEYEELEAAGTYHCRGCDAALYSSGKKFNAGCGWPAFWAEEATSEGASTLEYIEDRSLGMRRVEIRCARCGGHLGHVFTGEGFGYPTDARHCVNSASIKFVPEAEG